MRLVGLSLLLIALLVSLGFRASKLTWQDMRPTLSELKGAKDRGGCGTGSTLTRISSSHPWELSMGFAEAKKKVEVELLAQGWKVQSSAAGMAVWQRLFEDDSRSGIILRDYPGRGACTLYLSTRLQKLYWFGCSVEGPS